MSFKPFFQLLARRQLRPALAANALYGPFYEVCYIAALMDRLSGEAVTFERLAAIYAPDPKAREGLAAWLQMGCRPGLLGSSDRGYELEGLAKTLALPRDDATLALLQEVAGLHHRLITETPAKLRAGEPWTLDDQDGELTACSSRALEVFQLQALDRFLPASGPCHLLEVGCGSSSRAARCC